MQFYNMNYRHCKGSTIRFESGPWKLWSGQLFLPLGQAGFFFLTLWVFFFCVVQEGGQAFFLT